MAALPPRPSRIRVHSYLPDAGGRLRWAGRWLALAPVGPVDKDRLRSEIAGLDARGWTPIGNALRAAADEFTGTGPRSIVLVSDGIDTCAPPSPCEVAQELAEQGIGVTIHTVGFLVDDAARVELECIADNSGGTYRQADDADSLTEILQFLTQRAIESYETFGTHFDFADSPEDAKFLGAGLYQKRESTFLGSSRDGPVRYFRVAVPEGYSARIAVVALPNISADVSGGGQGFSTRLDGENDSSAACNFVATSDFGITAGADAGATDGDPSSTAIGAEDASIGFVGWLLLGVGALALLIAVGVAAMLAFRGGGSGSGTSAV